MKNKLINIINSSFSNDYCVKENCTSLDDCTDCVKQRLLNNINDSFTKKCTLIKCDYKDKIENSEWSCDVCLFYESELGKCR